MQHFDHDKWKEVISQHDWYLILRDELAELLHGEEAGKEAVEQFFETALHDRTIMLGVIGPNWDRERKPIDTIVIYQTHRPSGISWRRLSAMGLLSAYVPRYISPPPGAPQKIGDPIYAHHLRGAEQVFYLYHWLVRQDGSMERFLGDHEIGWHSGDRELDAKSIAICLDGNFDKTPIPEIMQKTLHALIDEHYHHVAPEHLVFNGSQKQFVF